MKRVESVLKKISALFFEIMLLIILCGCNIMHIQYVPFIGEFGPNESCSKYFYYRDYVRTESDGHFELIRYDVDTKEKQKVYVAETTEEQRIEDFYGDDKGVFFVLIEHNDGYPEQYLYYHDNISGQEQSVLCSRDDIFIINTNYGPIIGEGEKYYSLKNESGKYSLVETQVPIEEQASKGERKLGIRSLDGTVVAVISKTLDDPNYSYKLGDMEGNIDALNEKEAAKTELSNDYVVEDGKVIGVVQSTSINYKYYSGYDDVIMTGQLKGEALYEFDLSTCESRILYSVKGHKKQIIGYKDGSVYIYKKGKIIKRSVETGTEELIYEMSSVPKEMFSFNWVGITLVIFDEVNLEIIDSVKVEN